MAEVAQESKSIEEIREEVYAELKVQFEAEYARKLDESQKILEKQNEQMIQEALAEFRKSQKPPTSEELEKLLSQEYMTFTIKLPWGQNTRDFVIQELPGESEKKVYWLIKEKLMNRAGDLAIIQENADPVEKLKSFLGLIDPAMELLASAVAICLDPRGDDPGITKEWVLKTISTSRMWNILVAQFEVNKMRDFFSGGFRSLSGSRMI